MLTFSVASIVCCALVLFFAFIEWLTDTKGELGVMVGVAVFLTPFISAGIIHYL